MTVALIAVAAAGCGAPLACGCASPPPPVVLTAGDSGKTVNASIGSRVELHLTESRPVPGSSTTWDSPVSSDPAVLTLESVERSPAAASPAPVGPPDTLIAVFTAHSAGTATITANGHATCEAMNPAYCKQPAFTVTVTVS